MLKFSVRKKLSRILAGTLSVAMAMTMAPDIWLPVYADSVRNNILNTDIISDNEEIVEDTSVEDIINDDVIDETNDDEVNNNVQPYASQNIKYEYNGHTYSFIDIGMTWNNAKLYCENEGGHLATITSPEENDFLVDLISNGSMNTYWIGLTDGRGSNYSWITGEPFVESCGTIANYNTRQYFYQLQKDGIWNDHDDGLRNDFWDYTKCGILCEWDHIDSEPIPDELNYTVFSGSTSQGINLYGWKSYFTGNVYTGNNFKLSLCGRITIMENNHYIIRKLKANDLEKIAVCITAINSELSKELFVAPTIEYINTIISGYGYSAGIFIEDLFIGFASIVFPKLGKNNIGHYINMNNETLLSIAQLEHIYILPDFRGNGLAKKLINYLISKIDHKYTILLSTVSPQNVSSLSLAFNINQKIIAFTNIYNVNRFIMYRDLTHNLTYYKNDFVEILTTDIHKIIKILNHGYAGIHFGINKSTLIFRQEVLISEKISN